MNNQEKKYIKKTNEIDININVIKMSWNQINICIIDDNYFIWI